MKKLYFFILSLFFSLTIFAQTVSIISGSGGAQGTSGNVIVGPSAYHVLEAIYTATEIGAGSFETAGTAINKIGFYVAAVGTPTQVSTFKVYMKNVPAATATFTAGTYTTTGYTLVYDGAVDFSATGFNYLLLSAPFVRTPGNNLQVLVERLENATHTGFTFLTANGNNTSSTVLTSRRYNNAAAPTAASQLTTSAFRPAIEMIHLPQNDASVTDLIHPSISCYNSPLTVGVEISNAGLAVIPAGAASVSYKIRGANTFDGTASNSSAIPVGGSVIVNFSGINLNNVGSNFDTAKVTFAGDEDITNDTLYSSINTATTLALPQTEDAEGTLPVFGYVKVVEGDRQLWRIQTGKYGNGDMSVAPVNDSIVPRAPGTKYYLFDSYSGSNSTGFVSRLYSNCLEMPASNSTTTYSSKVKFWMTHDTLFSSPTPSPDSIYVSVSTDKGVTWTRLTGFARLDPTAVLNTWKQHEVDLSAYNTGQSIQVAFEGASYYGNAIGLDDIELKVCQAPTIQISYAGPFCKSTTTAQAVTQTGTTGGAYTASPAGLSINPTTGAITPSTSNAGTYTVTYTIAASGDCPARTATASVTIVNPPVAGTLSGNQTVCSNSTTTFSSSVSGGTWSSSNTAVATINATTGLITPVAAGTATMTYTVSGTAGCSNATGTRDVTVTTAPVASISYSSPYCASLSTPQTVTQTGTSGGTYSASPSGLSINSTTGAITPSTSNAGTYTVTYTIAAAGGCSVLSATASVTIVNPPVAGTLSGAQTVCSNLTTTFSSSVSGGTWSSSNTAVATINATTGLITPVAAGTATMTYTVSGTAGCSNATATRDVTVTTAPTASISYSSNTFCTTLSTPQTVTQTGATGGTYSATPAGLDFNSTTGAINPSASLAGNYTVTYTIAAAGGCGVVTATASVTIASNPSATISYTGALCAESTSPVAVTLTGTQGGSFSSSAGLTINSATGAITPSTSTPGTYTVTYAIAAGGGCAAFSTTTSVTVNQGTFNTFTETACDSYTWSMTGVTYTASGTYTHNYTNTNGCPSADYLNLTINNGTFNTVNQTACSSYTWTAGTGLTYTSSGSYTYTYTNGNGCPSADYLNLTIDNGTFNTINQTACNSYTWTAGTGLTYTSSGSYTHTYNNTNGCASADYLNLTITSTITNNISQSSCNSYTWTPGTGLTYTSSGTYTYNGTSAGGCDSIVYLTLTIRQATSSSETASSCNSYSWNGANYTSSGTYTYTTTNSVGCDSVVTLTLTINTGTFATSSVVRCQSYTWPANGTTYTTSGTYTHNYNNGNGCASADYLNLTIGNTPVTVNISQTACDSYTWNTTPTPNTYTTSGVYTWTGTTTTGCDSIVYLTLTINQSKTSSFATSGCGTVTLPWGQTVTSTGAYNHTYQTTLGCDSVVTANVTILQGTNTVQAVSVTAPYTFHGQTYLETGSYTYSYTNADGCASTDVLNLTVTAPKNGITLYPNPNRGIFQVIFKGNSGAPVSQAFVNVYDARGRKVMSRNLGATSAGMVQVNLTSLPKGIYQIEIVDALGTRLETDKMILQ